LASWPFPVRLNVRTVPSLFQEYRRKQNKVHNVHFGPWRRLMSGM
jgi:hypothetical protein